VSSTAVPAYPICDAMSMRNERKEYEVRHTFEQMVYVSAPVSAFLLIISPPLRHAIQPLKALLRSWLRSWIIRSQPQEYM
jgi:hypothetical protein